MWFCTALLVGSSLPSSLSVMPVAAAGATPSQLGLAIGPPGTVMLGCFFLKFFVALDAV